MQPKVGVALLVIVAVVLTGLWVWSPLPEWLKGPRAGGVPPVDVAYAQSEPLVVYHSVVENTHTYSGTLPIRACNTFSSGLSSTGNPPAVTLNFQIFDGDGTCAESSNDQTEVQPFNLSFSHHLGSVPSVVTVTINGTPQMFTVAEQ